MTNIDKFNKRMGREIIKKASGVSDVEWLSTGITPLDYAIGGGLPIGRMVTVSGRESSTKSSLALAIIANAQKQGRKCVFIDAEYAFNPKYAEVLGVDVEQLEIVEPNASHEALASMELFMEDNQGVLFVVDSVPALITKAEAESDVDQITMASQARFMASTLRRLTPKVSATKSVVLWINQLRSNLGSSSWDPYIEPGGMALKFYTSVSIRLATKERIMDGKKLVGWGVKMDIKKNKVGPPGGSVMVQYYFDKGFQSQMDWVTLGIEKGLITSKGPYYYWGKTKLGLGKEASNENLTPKQITELGLHKPTKPKPLPSSPETAPKI